MKFSKLARGVQRLSDLAESKDLKLQMMPWLVEEAIRLQKKLSKQRKNLID